jgi:hypothetical protein
MTRTWREPPGEWIAPSPAEQMAGWLLAHGPEMVADMKATFGFAATRELLAMWLSEHGDGRPSVIEHLQEPH